MAIAPPPDAGTNWMRTDSVLPGWNSGPSIAARLYTGVGPQLVLGPRPPAVVTCATPDESVHSTLMFISDQPPLTWRAKNRNVGMDLFTQIGGEIGWLVGGTTSECESLVELTK